VAHFTRNQDPIQRGAKVLADIVCTALLLTFAIVFFGFLGGLIAFVLLVAGRISIDYLAPGDDDAAGVVR
jgi:hypothetical protein